MVNLTPGVYRRAFDWRISVAGKETVPVIAAAFAGLSTNDWTEILEDYLAISRKRKNNKTAMAKLQLHLLEELMLAQGSIKHYREKVIELKQKVGEQPMADNGIKEDLAYVQSELFLHRTLANCMRAIGDGIAWRAFGHDRAALRALSNEQ